MSGRLRPNDTERACFIVNPRSGGGGTSRRVDSLRQSATRYFTRAEVWLTERPQHATELAARAVDEGFDLIAAVGGDGTASECVNGLFDGRTARRPGVVFTVVPAGTGSDFVRSLEMPTNLDDAVRIAAFGPDREGDVLHLTYAGHDGAERTRIGLNVTGFGMNGDTVARANRSSKRFGGTLTFLSATLASFARYSPTGVDVQWTRADGSEGSWSGPLQSCFIANGSWCGGGMLVGPGGSVADGVVELTIIPKMSSPRLIALTPRLYQGTLADVPGVVTDRITRLQVESESGSDTPIDVDGEAVGTLPLTAEVLVKAVRLRGVWQDRGGR